MIELKPLQREDFSKIVEWNKGKSPEFLFQWAGDIYKHPLTEEQIEKHFADKNENSGDILCIYKIVLEETHEMVGTIELRTYEKEDNVGRAGRFLLGEEARGKGVGKEALRKLVAVGFQQLNYNKITLGVFDFNEAAIACYEAVGFKKEKLIKRWIESSEGYWNLYEMSICKEN